MSDISCSHIVIDVTEPDSTNAHIVCDDSHDTDRRIDQRFGHYSGVGEDEEEFGFGSGFATDMRSA